MLPGGSGGCPVGDPGHPTAPLPRTQNITKVIEIASNRDWPDHVLRNLSLSEAAVLIEGKSEAGLSDVSDVFHRCVEFGPHGARNDLPDRVGIEGTTPKVIRFRYKNC